MQNKANFRKSQMNVNLYNTMDYENKSNWTPGENKPNSKPIKANFRKAQMNVNSLITKDYRKNDAFAVQKNKANSNPISVKPKMSANAFSQKDYENETTFRLQENKAKQSQFSNRKTDDRRQKAEYGPSGLVPPAGVLRTAKRGPLAMTCAKDLNRALGALKKEIIERIER